MVAALDAAEVIGGVGTDGESRIQMQGSRVVAVDAP